MDKYSQYDYKIKNWLILLKAINIDVCFLDYFLDLNQVQILRINNSKICENNFN